LQQAKRGKVLEIIQNHVLMNHAVKEMQCTWQFSIALLRNDPWDRALGFD